MVDTSRRRALKLAAAAGTIGLAGCAGNGNGGNGNGNGNGNGGNGDGNGNGGTTGNGNDDGGGDPIVIGTNYPISGDLAEAGQDCRAGVEIFAEEVNANGGIDGRQIELVHKDAPNADAGVSNVQELAEQEDVDAIVGSFSSSIAAASTEASTRYDVIYWETNGFAPSISEPGYQNVFHPNARTTNYGQEGGDIMESIVAPELETDVAELDVALLWENGEFGAATRDEMQNFAEDLGFNIVESIGYSAFEISDFSSQIEQLRSVEPDVLYHSGYDNDTQLFWSQAADLDLYIPAVIGNGTAYVNTAFRDAVSEQTARGIINVDQPHFNANPEWSPGVGDILSTYREMFDEFPNTQLMNTSYSVMQIFAEAAANADSFAPADFQEAVLDIEWDIGTCANGWGADFDEEHNRNHELVVQGTQWQPDEYTDDILRPDQDDGTLEVYSIYPEESRLSFVEPMDIPGPDYT